MERALPKYAAFQHRNNNKYLKCVAGDDKSIPNYVKYSADGLVSTPNTKYEFASAKTGGGLVNIRSCYNNKYFRADSSNTTKYVSATATAVNEDKSDVGCTLFELRYNSSTDSYALIHANSGNRVIMTTAATTKQYCLQISSGSVSYDHKVIDWSSLVVLPKHVVFKGDNNLYLASNWQDNHEYLRFFSDDPRRSTAGFETFPASDGSVRIKSNYYGKFWRLSPNWIWADSTDATVNNKDTVFWPVRVKDNVIGLRNMGNNKYCRRIPDLDWKLDCLNASESTITATSQLTMEENVLSREIYNVVFRLNDSRIYRETINTMDVQDASNKSSVDLNLSLTFTYAEEISKTWESSLEMKVGITTSASMGVPLIVDGTIQISTEFSGSYTWGETITTSSTKSSTHGITVPPSTYTKVSLLATKGYCDVPFSYTQRDVLVDGSVSITDHDDGVYTGVNSYFYHYDADDEPIK